MARCAAIGSDDGPLITCRMDLAIRGQHLDGNLQHYRVDVVAPDSVRSIVVRVVGIDRRGQNRSGSVTEIHRVEERSEVDKERIVRGSSPDAKSPGQFA